MQVQYRRKEVVKYVCLALSISPLMVFGDEPYPSNPLILNSGVTPNIMLFVDTSRSMAGSGIENATCKPGNKYYPKCADNGSIGIARRVLTELVSNDKNRNLNWGLFSFDNETFKSGILQSPIKNRSNEKDFNELKDKISGLYPYNSTPLAESTYEVSRYWRGLTTAYDKKEGNPYESPIKYRCQKNYQIIISDGEPSGDRDLEAASKDPALARYGIEYPFADGSDDDQKSDNFLRLTKFMYQQDMRNTNDPDLEGKSFNEKKFEIQNVTSYVVGFRIDLPLLKNAAEQAGGKYYTINHGSDEENEKNLAHSLSNAVASIIDQNSNAGGLAVEANAKSDNNFLYLPGFNSKGWYGELKRYSFHNGVINRDSMQEAGASLTKQASRKIYSATNVGKFTPFEFTEGNLQGTMTQSQQNSLGKDRDDQLKTIINPAI